MLFQGNQQLKSLKTNATKAYENANYVLAININYQILNSYRKNKFAQENLKIIAQIYSSYQAERAALLLDISQYQWDVAAEIALTNNQTSALLENLKTIRQRFLQNPDLPLINLSLGHTYYLLGNYNLAMTCFKRTLLLFPNNCLEADLMEHLQTLSTDPHNEQYHLAISDYLLSKGMLNDALLWMKSASEISLQKDNQSRKSRLLTL